jgi:uncharacterized membrane protein YkvA (DUF1232 family)
LSAGAIAAYALSPIDLIPDFIPIIGYLDDLIIVPVGIAIVVALIPIDLMEEFRSEADKITERPTSKIAAGVITMIWFIAAAAFTWAALVYFNLTKLN